MGFADTKFLCKIRERVPVIRLLTDFQKSVWYPILFAALAVISGTHGYKYYLPIMWVMCAFVIFSALFCDDNKVFFVPLFIMYMAVGFDRDPSSFKDSNGDMLSAFDEKAFKQLIVLAAVAVGSFLLRMIFDGSVASIFKKRRAFTLSILALDVVLVMNGVLRNGYDIRNLMYGAIMAAGLTVSYFLVCGMTERSKDSVKYACVTAVCASYTALLQSIFMCLKNYKEGTLIYENYDMIIRDNLNLGWGVTTVVSAMIVLGIPAAFYLADNCKVSFVPFFSAILFVVGAFIMDARSAIIVGVAVLVFNMAVSCFKGKKQKFHLAYSGVLVVAFACVAVYFAINPEIISGEIKRILSTMLQSHKGDSGRLSLWKNGIMDFKLAPVFGAGFCDGGYAIPNLNVYSNMYHCIGIEFLGAMGVMGCIAFAFHAFELLKIFFKKFSLDKLFIMMIPAMIIGMSIVDNFFFYFNFQIFYGAFLVIAEKLMEDDA